VRAGEPVADFTVDGRHGLERELADVIPGVAEPHLVKEEGAFADDAARFVGRGLLGVGVEAKRGGR
jgi:hypothetical protein